MHGRHSKQVRGQSKVNQSLASPYLIASRVAVPHGPFQHNAAGLKATVWVIGKSCGWSNSKTCTWPAWEQRARTHRQAGSSTSTRVHVFDAHQQLRLVPEASAHPASRRDRRLAAASASRECASPSRQLPLTWTCHALCAPPSEYPPLKPCQSTIQPCA